MLTLISSSHYNKYIWSSTAEPLSAVRHSQIVMCMGRASISAIIGNGHCRVAVGFLHHKLP